MTNIPERIKIIGHRGAAGLAPENTLAAIKTAIEMSLDYVEIDVRLTKDGELVVIHDSTLKRTTGIKKSRVHQLSLKEIKNLDAGSWFDPSFSEEKIPTLDEVLNLLNGKTGLMLEIKHSEEPPHVIADAVFRVLKRVTTPLPPLFIGSFSLPIINEVKKRAATFFHPIKLIGIVEKHAMLLEFIELGIDNMAVWHKIISPGEIQRLQHHRIPAWAFTVNDPVLALFLFSLGVSGIISNFPDRLLRLKTYIPASS